MKKKDKIKELELQVSFLKALLAKYVIKDALSNIPVPEYKKGSKESPCIVSDGSKEEEVIKKSRFQQKLNETIEGQKQAK